MAWRRPPRPPPTSPQMIPAHGLPKFTVPQAPNQVPRIIMPSRPMLTTPARSANRPPSPARRMGTEKRSMAPAVPGSVRTVVSSPPKVCTADNTKMPIAAKVDQRAHAGSPAYRWSSVREAPGSGIGAADGFITSVMPQPPSARCWEYVWWLRRSTGPRRVP
jgi:hypothetical protein